MNGTGPDSIPRILPETAAACDGQRSSRHPRQPPDGTPRMGETGDGESLSTNAGLVLRMADHIAGNTLARASNGWRAGRP